MRRLQFVFLFLALAACKEGTGSKRHLEIPINRKIETLLKEAGAATDDNKKAALYGEASELFIEKGDFRQAMITARQGERANPTQKQCLATIAEAQLAEGKITEADMTVKDLLQRHPGYGRANYVQGNLAASRGDLNGALKSYAAAEKNKFSDSRLLINTGAVALRAKRTGDALKVYERAIQGYPDLAEAYLGAGISAQKSNKKADAKKYFQKFVELSPHSSEANRVRVWLKGL